MLHVSWNHGWGCRVHHSKDISKQYCHRYFAILANGIERDRKWNYLTIMILPTVIHLFYNALYATILRTVSHIDIIPEVFHLHV